MSKVTIWQMCLGTVGFLTCLAMVATGRDVPQLWIVMSSSVALLGASAIYQIGKGGEDGK